MVHLCAADKLWFRFIKCNQESVDSSPGRDFLDTRSPIVGRRMFAEFRHCTAAKWPYIAALWRFGHRVDITAAALLHRRISTAEQSPDYPKCFVLWLHK